MEEIIALLRQFEAFRKVREEPDLSEFGRFLQKENSENHASADQSELRTDEKVVNDAGIDAMASYLLGGLSAYVEVWIKHTYQDLPIVSLGDFAIIKSVERLDHPSKKEIADRIIMESSTCIESIRRLVKKGLLQEVADEHDKRIKRVSLSEEGKLLSAELDRRMIALGSLLMGDLSSVEKKLMIPILKKLNVFHDQLYRNEEWDNINKRFGINENKEEV